MLSGSVPSSTPLPPIGRRMAFWAINIRSSLLTPPPSGASYSRRRRNAYAALWAIYTLVLAISGMLALAAGNSIGLLTLLIASTAGFYTYRIWTYAAKRLWLLIVV